MVATTETKRVSTLHALRLTINIGKFICSICVRIHLLHGSAVLRVFAGLGPLVARLTNGSLQYLLTHYSLI